MTISIIDVQKAYLAYFGRPADPAGLAYWANSDAATMSAGFAASAEYAALYSGMTADQRVEQVYQNLLGRASDAAGKAYWVNEFLAGRETVSSLVASMQANALGVDISTIDNRVAYAVLFTAQLDTPLETIGYNGTAAADAARNAVSAVTDTDISLSTAISTLVADVASAVTAAADAAVAAAAAVAAVEAAAAAAAAAAAEAAAEAAAAAVPPTLSSSTPADDATAVAVGGNLVLTFSENVAAGTGNILIKKVSDNSTVATIAVGDASQVTVSGAVVTINPTADLAASTAYYVTMASGVIKDTTGNPYAGISSTTALNFTTSGAVFTLTSSAPIITEPASGTKALTFVLTLGSAPTTAVTVDYATLTTGTAVSGLDFAAATGTVTFAAEQTVAHVSIVVNDDATPEGDETVAVLFSGASLAAPVTGTGTILKNDTAGLTVVLTAGTDIPVLGADDDTINTNAPNQLTSADTVAAGDGFDTLNITPTTDSAFTLDDAIFTNVSGIDKIVILTTGTGAQTITTGAMFNAAFGAAGADLQTTSTTGAMAINMSAVTGPATLTAITTESTAGNFITMGAGVTTVLATSTTGALTINSAASVVATVTATTTTGFVNVTTGSGADAVTVTTGDAAGGNVVATGAGNDTIDVSATTATTNGNTITGGLGADTLILTGNTSADTIVIGNTDSGITIATADHITGFATGIDFLKMGTVGDATPASGNYVEAVADVADFAAALAAANLALATLADTSAAVELYAFQWDAANGYLFNDTDGDGTADQVIVLVGIDGTTIAAADVIA